MVNKKLRYNHFRKKRTKHLSNKKKLPNFALLKKSNVFVHHIIQKEMSKVCQILGKKTITGNHVSHSNIKTKRKFKPNLQKKKFFIPEENRWVTLKVSAKGIRHINKNGITASLIKALEKGNIK